MSENSIGFGAMLIEILQDEIKEKDARIERLEAVVDWVDSWVSNPVGSYSVSALDGLFAMTRDRIAALAGTEGP